MNAHITFLLGFASGLLVGWLLYTERYTIECWWRERNGRN